MTVYILFYWPVLYLCGLHGTLNKLNWIESNVLTDELSFLDRVSPVSQFRLQHHGTKQQKIKIKIIPAYTGFSFRLLRLFRLHLAVPACLPILKLIYFLALLDGTQVIWELLSETRCKNNYVRSTRYSRKLIEGSTESDQNIISIFVHLFDRVYWDIVLYDTLFVMSILGTFAK